MIKIRKSPRDEGPLQRKQESQRLWLLHQTPSTSQFYIVQSPSFSIHPNYHSRENRMKIFFSQSRTQTCYLPWFLKYLPENVLKSSEGVNQEEGSSASTKHLIQFLLLGFQSYIFKFLEIGLMHVPHLGEQDREEQDGGSQGQTYSNGASSEQGDVGLCKGGPQGGRNKSWQRLGSMWYHTL